MQRTLVVFGCGSSKQAYWEWPANVDAALDEAHKSYGYVSDYGADTSSYWFVDRFEDIVSQGYPRFPAGSLYDSNYASLKRQYGEWFGDKVYVLSAEHGLIPSGRRIEPYDTHIDDVDIADWVATVVEQLHDPDGIYDPFEDIDRIEVLASRKYIEPLRDVFATFPATVSYPFQEADCSGIGDQMGWLRSELDEAVPESVNGWTFDPDSSYNGDVWVGDDGRLALLVRGRRSTTPYIKVYDERVDGLGGGKYVAGTGSEADWTPSTLKTLFQCAANWMEAHDPEEWEHPDVNEAVFDAPPGYELASYHITDRETTVYYGRVAGPELAPDEAPTHGRISDLPDDPDPVSYPFLVVHCWNGSGNATISLAPWMQAHDPKLEQVVDCPDECGLDIALTLARRYARDNVVEAGDVDEDLQVGQPTLGRWSG